MKQYQYDDVTGLQELVSEEWGEWSNEFEVTQDVVNQFADLTNDHNWIHVDLERCKKESPFGGPIAHGFLTLVLMPQMIVPQTFEISGFNTAVNYGLNKVRNMSPVPVGSKIHQRMRVGSVEKTKKGATQVVLVGSVHVVGQERPSVVYEMVMMYM